MKFLVDQNLPARLAMLIADMGWAADHVTALGLAQALDDEIRARAEATGAAVVSKDSHFVDRARRSTQAALLWLRIGNTPNRLLYDLVRAELPQAVLRLQAGKRVVEVHP